MKLKLFSALVLLFSNSLAGQTTERVLVLKASTDHADALYKAGETATFTIEALQDGKALADGKVVCVLSKDGVQPQPPQTLTVKDGQGDDHWQVGRAGLSAAVSDEWQDGGPGGCGL